MGVFYNEGEIKKRPGVYQRHSNDDQVTLVGARDGVCAIPVRASWGPVGVVLENKSKYDLRKNYGAVTIHKHLLYRLHVKCLMVAHPLFTHTAWAPAVRPVLALLVPQ